MRQSTAVKLASAVALAGSTQAYGQIIPLALPSNIIGNAGDGTEPREYYDISNGQTYSGPNADTTFRFEYFNAGFGYLFTAAKIYPGANPAGTGGLAADVNNYAPAIAAGTKVGSDTYTFTPGTGFNESFLAETYFGPTYSNQQVNTPEYLAFEFTASDGKLHDGYFEIETQTYTSPSSPGGLIFLQGAYNSQPDPGDGSSDAGDIVVPEPGTLSSLIMGAAALGAVGLVRRRRAIAAQA